MKKFLECICLIVVTLGLLKVLGVDFDFLDKDEKEEDPIVNDGPGNNEEPYVEVHSFALVGSMNNWDVTNQDYLMTSNGNLTYTCMLECNEGLLEFKIADHKSWQVQYNSSYVTSDGDFLDLKGDNIKIIGDGKYLLNLNAKTQQITITQIEEYEYVEKYSLTLVGTMNEWDVNNQDYMMTSNGDYTYSYKLFAPVLTEFKIVESCNWDNELNSNNVIENDYSDNVDGNIQIVEAGYYEIFVNYLTKKISISKSDEIELVTFTVFAYDTENYWFTDTVIKGTTWEEYFSKNQYPESQSGNFEFDLSSGTDSIFRYCDINGLKTMYDDEVTLFDEIDSTTYGRKKEITLKYLTADVTETFEVISGMTWKDFFIYYEELAETTGENKLSNFSFSSSSDPSAEISYCGGEFADQHLDTRITKDSYECGTQVN